MNWLVGTYSKRNSDGIYIIHFDEEKEEFIKLNSFPEISPGNPSFVISGLNNKIFAVGESVNGSPGVICSYILSNNELIKIDESETNGLNPCHLAINDQNDFLVAVNYSSGDFSTFSVDNEGKLKFIEKKSHKGSSINKDRQNEPHAHSINFFNNNNFFVCDLGIDKIIRYTTDSKSKKIIESNSYKTNPGAGPRHFIIDKENNAAYSINELDSTINFFNLSTDMDLISKQIISTIPKDYKLETTTADIHLSKDKNYLYGSNRGHDSISKFLVNNDGQLSFDKHFSTLGKTPRNFAITHSGKYCLVANENTDDIQSFKIADNGDLISTGEKISIPSPVCLLEIIK